MKICFIGKYPPTEGGISSSVYWLAKGLGKKGHKVYIVTNAMEVEEEFREKLNPKDLNFDPKNVYIHSTDPSTTKVANPSHIPFSKTYCEKLSSLAINVIEEYDIDIIDSWYLIPYCVAGYIAKSFKKIPQIVRHAGSDLQRLYSSPFLNTLLKKIILSADSIITNSSHIDFFKELGVNNKSVFTQNHLSIDTQVFNPHVKPFDLSESIEKKKQTDDVPIIGFFGKITYHFETKGLVELLHATSQIDEDFLLLFVANGNKLDEFKQLVNKENLLKKSIFLNFVPPWQMPSLLKSCTCVVSLEKKTSPVMSHNISNVPAEAIATGTCVLISNLLHRKEPYKHLENKKEILVVDPEDIEDIKRKLYKIIRYPKLADEIGFNAYVKFKKYNDFESYLKKTIELYQLLKN